MCFLCCVFLCVYITCEATVLFLTSACASALKGLPADVGVFVDAVAADSQQTPESIGIVYLSVCICACACACVCNSVSC